MDALVGIVVAFALCFAAAAIGGYATSRSLRDWYVELPKPSWNPPNAIFGPVWTVLYALMAIAAWLVWRTRDQGDVGAALVLFAAQLALNVMWSVVFFGLRRPAAAALVIALLWLAIAATIYAFAVHAALAALLLLPYLAWVSFATALNVAIARRAVSTDAR